MGLGMFLRTQWRDRKDRCLGTLGTGAIAAGTAVAVVTIGPIVAPVMIFALLPLSLGFTAGVYKVTGNYLDFSKDKRIVGDNRTLESIRNMSDYISDRTSHYRHWPTIPPAEEQRLLRHLGDIQLMLNEVRFHSISTGEPLEKSVTYERTYINEKGKTEQIAFATVTPDQIILPARPTLEWKGVPLVEQGAPEAAKALPAPAVLTQDFSKLSGDLRELQEKVAAIENPKPMDLDKVVRKPE